MKAILILACAGLLAACEVKTADESHKFETRKSAFESCMKLAATMPRQADDDVADIVKACDNHSYYMSNYAQNKAK